MEILILVKIYQNFHFFDQNVDFLSKPFLGERENYWAYIRYFEAYGCRNFGKLLNFF